ncbi:MAG: hypothetical protein R2867_20775 [Caldilineaceae bacterium]
MSVPPGRCAPFQRAVTKLYLTLATDTLCGMGSLVFLEGVTGCWVTEVILTPSRKTRVPYDPGQSGLLPVLSIQSRQGAVRPSNGQ